MVNFEHSEYKEHKGQVDIVNKIFMGTDKSKEFLVKFPQEADETFADRKNNLAIRNFVKRASEAFVGMIFRKEITVSGYSNRIKSVLNRIDKKTSVNQFSREVSTNLILDGKTYLYAENSVDGSYEPYLINIKRNNVINWKKDGSGKFTMVVIKEIVTEDSPEDMFETIDIEQYRVLLEYGQVLIYRFDKDGNEYIYETIETGIDYIPLVELDLSMTPSLYDIAKLNIKHLNRTSSKDRYLDMSACPVPVIWGADVDDEGEVSSAKPALVIGVDEAFIFNGTKDECDFQWRELQGTSINELQKDLNVIEKDITSGVIRASQSDSSTIKTATQAYYESAEASNRVTVIANIVEYGLNVAVGMIQDYINEPINDEGFISISKDYNAISSDSGEVRVLWEMYLAGALSIETMLTSIEQYEMANIGNVQDELDRIAKSNFIPKPVVDSTEVSKSIDNRSKIMPTE